MKMQYRDTVTGKLKRIQPSNDLIGSNYALRIETVAKITFLVSPAVFELLQDNECSDTVAKQLVVIDRDDIARTVHEEINLFTVAVQEKRTKNKK